jgi:hypothetical protein
MTISIQSPNHLDLQTTLFPGNSRIEGIKDQGLNLLKGDLVTGWVEAVKDNGMVILNLGGQIIEAHSQVILQPDQVVNLQVQGWFKGQLLVKPWEPATQVLNTQGLVNILDNMGISISENSMAIAAKLLEFQLPITAQNIMAVQRSLGILGGVNEDSLQLAVFLLGSGSDLNPEGIKTLQGFFRQPGDLNQDLTSLLNLINGVGEGEQKGSEFGKLVSGLNLLLEKVVPSSTESPAVLADYLKEWPKNSRVLTELLKVINLKLENGSTFSATSSNIFDSVRQGIVAVVNELFGQQILHTLNKSTADQPDFYYFSYLMPPLGKEAKGELKVYKRENSRSKLSGDNLRVVFSLETPNLGVNQFDVQICRKELLFRVKVQNDEVCQMVVDFWPELTDCLKKLGYNSSLLECGVDKKPKLLRPKPEPKTIPRQVRRIDVQV